MNLVATITVIGKDKTGVIARVTNFLFERGANIEALEEQVTRGQFSMTLQATWNRDRFDEARVRDGLHDLGRALAMEISMRLADPKRRPRFAIMATREPHCLEALLRACAAGQIRADPALVAANR